MKKYLLIGSVLFCTLVSQAQITFSDLNYPIAGNKPQCIKVATNGNIYVGADSAKILRSTDGGLSFTKTYVVPGQGTSSKVWEFCETSQGTILAYGTAGKVYRSTNGGNSWTTINTGIFAFGPFFFSVHSSTVFIHEGSRVRQSVDDGLTWSYWGTQQGNYVDLDNNAKAYIAGQNISGLYTSTDGNNTASSVASTANLMVNKVLVTPDQYVHLYIGTADYKNSNDGTTFTSHYPSGLSTLSDMINYGNTIIIGAGGASGPGIKYTSDHGATFQSLTAAMGSYNYITFYNFMSVDNNGILYVIAEDNSGTKKLMKTSAGIAANPNGIKEVTASADLLVYPNPANDVVSIKLTGNDELLEIVITDVLGKAVLNTNAGHVDVNKLANGVYILNVITKNNVLTKKINVVH